MSVSIHGVTILVPFLNFLAKEWGRNCLHAASPASIGLFVTVFQYPEDQYEQDGTERNCNPDAIGNIENAR